METNQPLVAVLHDQRSIATEYTRYQSRIVTEYQVGFVLYSKKLGIFIFVDLVYKRWTWLGRIGRDALNRIEIRCRVDIILIIDGQGMEISLLD